MGRDGGKGVRETHNGKGGEGRGQGEGVGIIRCRGLGDRIRNQKHAEATSCTTTITQLARTETTGGRSILADSGPI